MPRRAKRTEESTPFVETHLECTVCREPGAMSVREDGSAYCFAGCGNKPGKVRDGGGKTPSPEFDPMAYETVLNFYDRATHMALPSRKITRETCEALDIRVLQNEQGEWLHLYPYRNERGRIVDIKVRNTGVDGKGKDFYWKLGKKNRGEEPGIMGVHRWESKGKMLVLTEGEVDYATVSQAFGNQFSHGSLPHGIDNAAKAVAQHLERIADFEKVVLWLDDEPKAREAAEEIARILPPGKVAIVQSGIAKDANQYLQDGASFKDITRVIWNAPIYRPDGIVTVQAVRQEILSRPTMGLPWPWETMNGWTYGRRPGELIGLGAGTGQGKSDLLSEVVAYNIFELKEPTGVFAWESGPAGYVKQVLGKRFGKRFHIPVSDEANPEWEQKDLEQALAAYDALGSNLLFLNNHRGATDWDSVKERIRYLVHAEGVRHIILDPLTALSALAEDERREMEKLMAEAAALTAELNLYTYFTSHLATPDGQSHEEGGRVELRHFKGSRAVGFWCNFAFGMERNQQAETEEERCRTTIRCLKDRYTGNALGKTMSLYYNRITGRLEEPVSRMSVLSAEDQKIADSLV